MEKTKEIEKEEAIKELRAVFKQSNHIVYTNIEHVSKSGMMRYISAFVIGKDRQPYHINHLIAKLGHFKRATLKSHYEGLKVYGCGMDMGFELVYTTSSIVFGSLTKKQIVSITKPRTRNGIPEASAGYVLRQKWI